LVSQRHPGLIVALDFGRLEPAYALARRLAGQVALFKVGSQLFTAEGPRGIEKLSRLGAGIFLDLKFHDIPNTVAGAVRAAAELPGIRVLDLHIFGGKEMMEAAVSALAGKRSRIKLLGITLLTSMDARSLRRLAIPGRPESLVVRLARLGKEAGLDGVVAAGREVRAIRQACGRDFLIVVPGIRPAAGVGRDDQARVSTPGAAIEAGADYLVVGRPITAVADPVAAARATLKEMRAAASSAVPTVRP
jgi:orotidine-5'-phosphate decarboxylase